MPRVIATSKAKEPATRGIRVGGRSERVVADVLRAAGAELAARGYQAFRMEEVATVAGVNKTTVYRRWQTKADLIEAALRAIVPRLSTPNSGSLETDLFTLIQSFVRWKKTPEGAGVLRTLHDDVREPDLERIVKTLERETLEPWLTAIAAGKKRNELPASFDARLLVQMIAGPTLLRLHRTGDKVDDETLATIVRVVLSGARTARR